jgi:indole-3-glycerol phosphate synthase
MSFLETIIAYKKQEVTSKRRAFPRSGLESMPNFGRKIFSLVEAIRERNFAVIPEIKNVRPSNSFIRKALDPLTIAQELIRAGAAAISIPTDEKFALGRLEFIKEIRNHVAVPVLQRDYIVDSYQLCESKAYGADAVLLMAAVLKPGQITDFAAEAEAIGLECVVEIHDEDELDPLDLSTIRAISINNRDLHTFEMNVYTSVRLKKHIPGDKVVITDGGIMSTDEIDLLLNCGIHAFLIGGQPSNAETSAKMLNDMIETCQQNAAKLGLLQVKK